MNKKLIAGAMAVFIGFCGNSMVSQANEVVAEPIGLTAQEVTVANETSDTPNTKKEGLDSNVAFEQANLSQSKTPDKTDKNKQKEISKFGKSNNKSWFSNKIKLLWETLQNTAKNIGSWVMKNPNKSAIIALASYVLAEKSITDNLIKRFANHKEIGAEEILDATTLSTIRIISVFVALGLLHPTQVKLIS